MCPVDPNVAPEVPPSPAGVARGAPQSHTSVHAEAILRAIPDMMFRMTRDGVYLDFKAEREADLYVPADQIIGHRIEDLLPTDLGRTILELIGQVLDSGELRIAEYELQKQAGLRAYEARMSVSGPDEVVAIVRDVTEAKLAQRELRQTAERLEAILGNLPVVLFALDTDGRCTLSEGKGLENLGIVSGDMLGKSALEAYADAPDIIASFRRALSGEEFMTARDFHGRSLETRYAPLRDESGVLTGTIGVTVDVTEQVAAERALVASESRFRLLTEHSNDVLCEMREGRITYISPNCYELSGKPPEYYIGRTPGDVTHPDDLQRLAHFLAPGWIGQITATFRVRHADGDWRWREMSGVRVIEDGGPRTVVVLRDIDARVKAEEARRSVEQKYLDVVNAARDVIYTHDLEGNFTSVNPAAGVLYGYTIDEVLAMNFADFVDPVHLPIARENQQRAMRGEPMIPVQVLTHTRDKTALWMEVVAAPIVENGAVVGFQGIARDVTDRKEAEQALVDSEEKYRRLVDGAHDIIYTTDLAGEIVSVNPAVERILGYTPEEVLGLTTLDLVDESQRAALAENYAEWRLTGVPERVEEWLARAKDGEPVWIETTATALEAGGRPVGILVIGRDVTERKRAAAEARNAEERAALLRERARIAQELHDSVAQYFFGIGIAAKDMLDRKPVQPATLRRRLTDIRKLSTQGGREVRNAVYALSSTEPADGLDASLTRLCAAFEETAGVTVQYRNSLAIPLPPPVARELYSAAREALYNVRKHASASTISIRLVGDADRTTLEVSDDGIGTALAVNDAIAAGGGFGLRSMSERFALLGGRVEVIDGEHAGVTVCCTLPREAA